MFQEFGCWNLAEACAGCWREEQGACRACGSCDYGPNPCQAGSWLRGTQEACSICRERGGWNGIGHEVLARASNDPCWTIAVCFASSMFQIPHPRSPFKVSTFIGLWFNQCDPTSEEGPAARPRVDAEKLQVCAQWTNFNAHHAAGVCATQKWYDFGWRHTAPGISVSVYSSTPKKSCFICFMFGGWNTKVNVSGVNQFCPLKVHHCNIGRNYLPFERATDEGSAGNDELFVEHRGAEHCAHPIADPSVEHNSASNDQAPKNDWGLPALTVVWFTSCRVALDQTQWCTCIRQTRMPPKLCGCLCWLKDLSMEPTHSDWTIGVDQSQWYAWLWWGEPPRCNSPSRTDPWLFWGPKINFLQPVIVVFIRLLGPTVSKQDVVGGRVQLFPQERDPGAHCSHRGLLEGLGFERRRQGDCVWRASQQAWLKQLMLW